MKELYISPELNLLCFAPVERLAVDADEFLENPDQDNPATSAEGDLSLDLDIF